jgi:hypothetical protein
MNIAPLLIDLHLTASQPERASMGVGKSIEIGAGLISTKIFSFPEITVRGSQIFGKVSTS